MLIHSSRKVTGRTLELSADGSQIEQICTFKLLGVTINDTLTWSDQINVVCAKVSLNLSLDGHLSWFLPQSFLLLFLKSYILHLFNYCDVVWSGCTMSEASRLETLLNYACCTVLYKCKGSSALAARRELAICRSFQSGFQEKTLPCSYHIQLYVFQVPTLSISAFFFAFIPLQNPLHFVFPVQPST